MSTADKMVTNADPCAGFVRCVFMCREDEEGFLGMASHATLEVLPSRDIKVGHMAACALPAHVSCIAP
jgi:hypothetical protein